jgi:hypothetical protein
VRSASADAGTDVVLGGGFIGGSRGFLRGVDEARFLKRWK